MKITIYELLGLIKDGKAPKKIKVTGNIYEFDEEYNFYVTQGTYEENIRTSLGGKYGETNLLANAFNEIVEIVEDNLCIEELKIECMENQPSSKYIVDKYGKKCFLTKHSKIIADKVNEVIRNQQKIIKQLENK